MSSQVVASVRVKTYLFKNEHGNTVSVVLSNVHYVKHGAFATVPGGSEPSLQIQFHFGPDHCIKQTFPDEASYKAALAELRRRGMKV